ncbi:hypothetical protein [Streptomyces hydrogenans]|uniref:hypothetical protein n=1 Tax=Streptomyces hydrogenans TaxID=1873719 RepID=UPI00167D24C5|nr:hypothetical protein [Streptomyces hydrogenans]GHG45491.1 hypothetical protein GCM10018784_69280 [Streptomyces hydrogenans]
MQRVLQHHAEVTRMVATGYPLSDIARRLQLDRKTIHRYRDISLDDLLSSSLDRRPEQVDAFKPYVQQQCAAGVTSGRTLFRAIHERGFRGGYSTGSARLNGPAPFPSRSAPRSSAKTSEVDVVARRLVSLGLVHRRRQKPTRAGRRCAADAASAGRVPTYALHWPPHWFLAPPAAGRPTPALYLATSGAP